MPPFLHLMSVSFPGTRSVGRKAPTYSLHCNRLVRMGRPPAEKGVRFPKKKDKLSVNNVTNIAVSNDGETFHSINFTTNISGADSCAGLLRLPSFDRTPGYRINLFFCAYFCRRLFPPAICSSLPSCRRKKPIPFRLPMLRQNSPCVKGCGTPQFSRCGS